MSSAAFSDRSGPGGVQWSKGSAYAQEMAKWEMGWNEFGKPGRPREVYGNQEYPLMCYKMRRSNAPHEVSAGPFVVVDMTTADDENALRNLQSRGYVVGRKQAEDALVELEEKAIPLAAAERAFSEQRMSDKAKAEADAYELSTGKHAPEIPEKPIRRRGRPRKVEAAIDAAPVAVQE